MDFTGDDNRRAKHNIWLTRLGDSNNFQGDGIIRLNPPQRSIPDKSMVWEVETADYPKWHRNRIDAFKQAVDIVFREFMFQCKLDWDIERGLYGKPQLKMTVRTRDWGQISTELPLEWLKSVDVPKDLPQQLLLAFERQFENKKERLVKKEWEVKETTRKEARNQRRRKHRKQKTK